MRSMVEGFTLPIDRAAASLTTVNPSTVLRTVPLPLRGRMNFL